jgi:hypothetical protein
VGFLPELANFGKKSTHPNPVGVIPDKSPFSPCRESVMKAQ